jgi:pilus assembly protein Flp/PilA
MKSLYARLAQLFEDESGPTAIEYAIMLSFIVIVCVGSITSIGTNLVPWFQATANVLR